jgi:hypothetical protein
MGKIIEVPVRQGRSAERDAPGLRQQPEGSAERSLYVGARCRRCRIPAITYATNRAADGTAALSRPV